jgi:hypothetical protein
VRSPRAIDHPHAAKRQSPARRMESLPPPLEYGLQALQRNVDHLGAIARFVARYEGLGNTIISKR